jgi:hypothetical protein
MKNIILLILLIITVSCNETKELESKKISILVDMTCDDKKEVIQKLNDYKRDLFSRITNDKSSFLGATVQLSYIDSKGESRYRWKTIFPKKMGRKSNLLKYAIVKLLNNFKATTENIQNNTERFSSSNILPQLRKTLINSDRVILISDLYVVDRSRNFERDMWGKVVALYDIDAKSKLKIYRVSKKNKNYDEIRSLVSWWDAAVDSNKTFKNYIAKSKRKKMKMEKYSMDVQIKRRIKDIKLCLNRKTVGRIDFIIEINQRGKVVNTNNQNIKGVDSTLSRCLSNVIKNIQFKPHNNIANLRVKKQFNFN